MSDFLFILAAVLMSVGLRTFSNPVLFKLGSLGFPASSFLAGYFVTRRWEAGALCAFAWLLLPWLEILTRVRNARLPRVKPLRHQIAPSEEVFPDLDSLTKELEEEGFAQAEDAGWNWEDHRQFFRLFYKSDERVQASICLIEQEDFVFYYLSLSSRGADGTSWTTWNYPFSYSMKFSPQFRTQRLRGDVSVLELLEGHREFLTRSGVGAANMIAANPEEMPSYLQRDMEDQIDHNLATGLLLPEGEGMVRYSWRGMFFIWREFLRDFVRFF